MSNFLFSTGGLIVLFVLFYIFFIQEPYTVGDAKDPVSGYTVWTGGLSNDDIQTAINATAAYLSEEICVYGIETTNIKKYISDGGSIRYVCSFMFTSKNTGGYPYVFKVDSVVDDGKATSVIRETDERLPEDPALSYLPYSEIKEFKLNK